MVSVSKYEFKKSVIEANKTYPLVDDVIKILKEPLTTYEKIIEQPKLKAFKKTINKQILIR